ncbi:hypothetical protein [Desulfovibrio sp. TomC]|uniref:hypothetical protein n=1 Tax=Desulfovibrio sp. TomC TaxID=1562888 RepID=UPI00057451D4|nr:hypothetical protein [Desulfovibrio sp. TomC]KHK03942.1 hypothetical protein NY78_0384 [Desulfovibrio sp. TomC]
MGNLIATRGKRTFDAVYGHENRSTTLILGGKTRTYAYDDLGNRGRIQTGTATRNFHHAHLGRVIFETDGSGQVTINSINTGNFLVASGTTAAGFRFHHQDKTGNTMALSEATGAVVGRYGECGQFVLYLIPQGTCRRGQGSALNHSVLSEMLCLAHRRQGLEPA